LKSLLEKDTDQHAYDVFNWLERYWNGDTTLAGYPHKVHVEDNVDGEPEFVNFQGHKFHIDEVHGESEKYKARVVQYMKDQHGLTIDFDDITPEEFPNIGFDQNEEPVLFGDMALHAEINAPENVAVTRDAEGTVHQIWRPPTTVPKEIMVV